MRYALIKGDEDGNPVSWLDASEVEDIAALMENYSISRFMDDVPEEPNPNYWTDGEALLLEVRVLKVRPKEVVTSWAID